MRKLSLLLLCAVFLILVGCGDEPDGKWAKMKWKVPSDLTKTEGIFMVPASGGTFVFTCKNYKPWICGIIDNNGLDYPIDITDVHNCEGAWFAVNCNQNDVTFSFDPLSAEEDSRGLQVTLTAGDIFDYFTFRQAR